jgi:cobalt-zinc-cadmium efflux system outer membrane protein
MQRKLLVYIFLFLSCLKNTTAQVPVDTLQLKLADAEKLFLDSNYSLLAQKYNIDVNKALIIQAKLLPNPNISLDRGPVLPIYDPTSQYPHSNFFNNTENQVAISQMFLLAGKRNKNIKLAEANAKLSEYQFYDLIRTLKFTLRTDFYNIYFLQQSMKVYKEEIDGLQVVVDAYKKQEAEGKNYISEKDIVRMKAQLYSLESEYQSLVDQTNDMQSELKLIIQVKASTYLVPVIDTNEVSTIDPLKYPLATLLDSAYNSRTDLQIAKTNTDISKLNYSLQKAMAVPDLTASLSYDKQGSYAVNLITAGVSIDLPFFNRNQGNIKSAKYGIDYNTALQKSTELTVNENVYRSLQKAIDADKLYRKIDPSFDKDYKRLSQAALDNFKKHNMGLLDFLDFYDSYKQNTLQINSIKFNKMDALEQINFYTGTNFFN